MLSILIFLGGCFVFGACLVLIWAVLFKLVPSIIKTPFIFFKSAHQGVREGREKWQNANAAWDDLPPEAPPTLIQEHNSWDATLNNIKERQKNQPKKQPISAAWKDLKATFKDVGHAFRLFANDAKAELSETRQEIKEKNQFFRDYKDGPTSETSR